MNASHFPFERRMHPRFQPWQVFFAVNSHLGMVENISLGGLAFRIIDRGDWQEGLARQGILFGEDDLCLDGLPIGRLSRIDRPLAHERPPSQVQRLRAQFTGLSRHQQRLLEGFIRIHT